MISVTEVLERLSEPELVKWQLTKGKAYCERVSKDALKVGTIVDKLVQDDIKTGRYEVPKEDESVASCMKAWESFKKEKPDFVASVTDIQKELTDGELIGHPDILTADTVWDIKTSKSIYPRYWTQVAQYARMAGRTKVGVIRLDKENGIVNWEWIEDEEVLRYEWEVFDAHLELFYHNTRIGAILREKLEKEIWP